MTNLDPGAGQEADQPSGGAVAKWGVSVGQCVCRAGRAVARASRGNEGGTVLDHVWVSSASLAAPTAYLDTMLGVKLASQS